MNLSATIKISALLLLAGAFSASAQEDRLAPLREQWAAIAKPYKATIGIGLRLLESGDTVSLHNDHAYPMLSVYKFPLAMAVLHDVEQGKYTLDKKIHILKKDLPKSWSPIRDKYPEGNIDMSVKELLYYSVSLSDNNACDLLFRLAGGTGAVQDYIHSIGMEQIAIAATEREMHRKWNAMYTNWSTPLTMTALLTDFYFKRHLSDSSSSLLMQLMIESSNSAKRIKGQLPENIIVAHKTGTSGSHEKSGLIAACNDVGIITLPDGRHLALTVFVSDSMEEPDTNERIIAEIALAAFHYFSHS